MKPILVLYATLEGHSLRVAEHAARRLRERGLGARVLDVRDARPPIALTDYRAALLVAPVHVSRHPRAMLRFVRAQRDALSKLPARFLSLSLSQAGVELPHASAAQRAQAERDVQHLIALFCRATAFPARDVVPIAGCLAYTRYGFVKRRLMRRIARRAGGSTDMSRDHVYTDFARVDGAVDALCGELGELPAARRADSAEAR